MGDLKKGSDDIKHVRAGNLDVKKIMKGDDLVWSSATYPTINTYNISGSYEGSDTVWTDISWSGTDIASYVIKIKHTTTVAEPVFGPTGNAKVFTGGAVNNGAHDWIEAYRGGGYYHVEFVFTSVTGHTTRETSFYRMDVTSNLPATPVASRILSVVEETHDNRDSYLRITIDQVTADKFYVEYQITKQDGNGDCDMTYDNVETMVVDKWTNPLLTVQKYAYFPRIVKVRVASVNENEFGAVQSTWSDWTTGSTSIGTVQGGAIVIEGCTFLPPEL